MNTEIVQHTSVPRSNSYRKPEDEKIQHLERLIKEKYGQIFLSFSGFKPTEMLKMCYSVIGGKGASYKVLLARMSVNWTQMLSLRPLFFLIMAI